MKNQKHLRKMESKSVARRRTYEERSKLSVPSYLNRSSHWARAKSYVAARAISPVPHAPIR